MTEEQKKIFLKKSKLKFYPLYLSMPICGVAILIQFISNITVDFGAMVELRFFVLDYVIF